MSFRVYVLGRGRAEVTPRQLAEFVHDGCYFDAPAFKPEPRSAEATDVDWAVFEIFEHPDAPPMRILSERPDRVTSVVEVVTATFHERDLSLPVSVSAHLRETRHVYVIEIDRGSGISDDAWAMLSAIEAFLAKQCSGIIFSSEDGVYDSALSHLVNFRAE